jgi:hypothetical protein
MKKLIIFLFLIGLLACEENNSKIFNAESLDDLNLASIDGFWDAGIDIDTSYYMGALWERYTGFIGGIRLSGGEKNVSVSVFETHEIAINAMQALIGDAACVIEEGTTDEIKDTWWFSDCIPDLVFVCKLNTIIQVGIYSLDFSTVEDTLYQTANEIAIRVFKLSE